MSTTPRPWSRPPRISGTNGSLDQPSPGGTTSRWPAKPKCGRAGAARREQILDRPVRRLAGDEAVDREAEPAQRRLQHVEHRAGRGRDAGAGGEAGGEVDGVDCGAHSRRPSIARREKRHAEARPRRDRTDQPHRLSAALRRADGQAALSPARAGGRARGFRRQPCRARARRHLQPAPLARGRGRAGRDARRRGGADRGRGRDA